MYKRKTDESLYILLQNGNLSDEIYNKDFSLSRKAQIRKYA